MQFFQELEKTMINYRQSGEGYTDEEMRVLKRICKDTLADIHEYEQQKEKGRKERRKKEQAEQKKRKEKNSES